MENNNIQNILENTVILKRPRQSISTFGTTNIKYYLLSRSEDKTQIREGQVISFKPEIVMAQNIEELFEGFGESAGEYARKLFELTGKNPMVLNYKFKNNPGSVEETSQSLKEVYNNLKEMIEKKEDRLSAIIKTSDKRWQIPVMKFILDMTLKSAENNIRDLEERGMFPDQDGIPQNVRNKIEYLFKEAKKDSSRIKELGRLLNKYGIFEEYEERFFNLF